MDFWKKQIFRMYVQNVYKYYCQKIFEIFDYEYLDWIKLQSDKIRWDNVMEMISDGQYVVLIVKMVREYVEMRVGIYFYFFGYFISFESKSFLEWLSGVFGDELLYVFGVFLVDGILLFLNEYIKNEK